MVPAIGYALWEANRPFLNHPAIDGVEITFERADDPLRLRRAVGELKFAYVSLHALRLSVGGAEPPARAYLNRLEAIADENDAAAVSDHLGFTRDNDAGIELGHFAPPPYTVEALDATCRNIEVVQNAIGDRPFFVENIATLFHFRGTMREDEFLSRLLERTGCGWLLDVTNLYANAGNHGFDADDFLRRVMPVASRVQIHLSGGFFDAEEGLYVDSHSHPVPEAVWGLYHRALALGPGKVEAVFIERDDNFPDEAGWRDEVAHARRIAESVEARR